MEMAHGPPRGERVKLRRAELAATGTIVWTRDNRLGIRFERPIHDQDWLPAKARGQGQVDSTFQRLKAAPNLEPRASERPLPTSARSAEELAGIADMLDALADSLSEDPHVVSRFMDKLQVLDLASQQLRRLSENP